MEHRKYLVEDDQLRNHFTGWLDVVVSHARTSYFRKYGQETETVYLDSVPDEWLALEDKYDLRTNDQDEFEFEEDKLQYAFSQLPLMKRRILMLLFVEQMDPGEVASQLHCSVQNVYNQKSLALKTLRKMLGEE